MAFIPAINTAEVVIQQELASQVVDTVINFLFDGALTETILGDLCDTVIAEWATHLPAIFSTAFQLIAVKATDLTTASSPSVTVPSPTVHTGSVASPPTSNNVALVLSERTESRGRSYRGRVYAAGMPSEERSDATTMSADYVGDFINAWLGFFNAIEGESGGTHVVVSRAHNNAPRSTAVMTEITSYSANRQLDSQRRRLAGRGI